MLTLTDILEALTGHRIEPARLVFSEAAVDSRQVLPGGLFIALETDRTEALTQVRSAFKRHASLALVQHNLSPEIATLELKTGLNLSEATLPVAIRTGQPFCLCVENALEALQTIARFWRHKQELRVVAVTGSEGRSTTKELIADVLSLRYRTLKSSNNYPSRVALPLSLLRLGRGYQRAVLEIGSTRPGETATLSDIALPHVGVVTNTLRLDEASTDEAVIEEQAGLVQALPSATQGALVLNADDALSRRLGERSAIQPVYFGLDPTAHLWADEVESMGLEGIRFRLHCRGEIIHMRVPLLGHYSVHTALSAAAVGLAEGLTWSEIASGLRSSPSQLRLVAVRTKTGALILDDSYSASAESTLASLNLLGEMQGRRIAVLGDLLDPGQSEELGSQKVGARAAEVAQYLIAVGEHSKGILDSARRAGFRSNQVNWVPEAMQAVEVLRSILKEGDVVLVKGSQKLQMERIANALEVSE